MKSLKMDLIKLEDFVRDYVKKHKYFSNDNISIDYILNFCEFTIYDFKTSFYQEKLLFFRRKLNYKIAYIIKRLKKEGFIKLKQFNTKTYKVIQ